MKIIYLKRLFPLLFLFTILNVAYTQLQKTFESTTISNSESVSKILDECEPATNLTIDYEMNMPTSRISWDGEMPQEGWVLLYGSENTIDINWYLSDPENYENPEANIERVYSNQHYLYMNMFHPGMHEIYVISDCGDGILVASEKLHFEMGERGEEVVGEGCDTPVNVIGVQNDATSIDLSWDPQDGGLYQIAWGPFGIEMNESFFDDPQTGSVIVSANPYHLEFPRPGAEEPHSIFIRKFCEGNSFSEWTYPECYPPTDLEDSENENEIVLNWTPAGQEFGWQVAYGPQGINPDDWGNPNIHVANVYDNPTLTLSLSNLQQGITYDYYIRANCSASSFSSWTGPGSFDTEFLPCNPVENLDARHITHQSADIYWTPLSSESEWEVTYGLAPLDINEAITVTVNNNPKKILLGLQSSSEYELFITANCVSGETAQSEIISFTTTEGDDVYCIPYFLNGCSFDFIDHLILDGENDTRLYDLNTGCTDSNYDKRIDQIVDLAPGNQYFARVSKGNFPISGDNLAVWIDFNDDGTFDESERVGDGSLASGGFTNINFSIPDDANPGEHRMRIMLAFNAYPHQLTPCNDGDSISSNGEVHDYTANILSLEDCNSVSAGNTMDDFEVCAGENFSISTFESSDPANGLIRKWQSSPTGQNNWTDVAGGLLPTITIYGGIQQATDFRYVVSCALSGDESISDILHITMSTNCFCKPSSECGGPGGLQINNVTLVGESITLNNQTGCDGGYGDHTLRFAPDLKQGGTYILSLTANNASLNDDKMKAWIDFNNNNIFEPEEIILDYPSGFPDYTITSEFMIPEGIVPGIYRMRARIGWLFSPPIEGCSTLGYGETEDYFIEVIPGDVSVECSIPSDITIEQEEDPTSATISWIPGGEETQWEVVYIEEGSDPENEDPILVSGEPSLFVNDLEPLTEYEVYVRAACDGGELSEWSEPVGFITGDLSIRDANFENFTYFPVPTENKLNLRSMVPVEKVSILDMTGQTILSFHPAAKTSELDMSKLFSGVYFMKIQIKGKSKVYKIIKK